jgi:hypothetical protein
MQILDWFIIMAIPIVIAWVYVHLWQTIERIKARHKPEPKQRQEPKPCDCKTPDICNLNDRCMK